MQGTREALKVDALKLIGQLLELPSGIVELNKVLRAKGLSEIDPKEVAAVKALIANLTPVNEPGKG